MGFSEVINGSLKKVSVLGGPPVTITDAATTIGMSWGPDDTIVFATVESRALLRVPAAGGEPEVLTTVDAGEGESGIETEPAFTTRNPEVLFALDGHTFNYSRNYAVAPDGERFLMIKPAATTEDASAPAPQIIVILNWGDELKRLVPAN